MKKPPGIQTGISRVRVLVVSPDEQDHHTLRQVLHSATWTLFKALTLTSALRQLSTRAIDMVVCERDLVPGTWKDMLTGLAALATPPLLIVTSRLADEHLWAEALNLGAYDVLSKPLDVSEVERSLHLACQHCPQRHDSGGGDRRLAHAAGAA